MSMREALNQAKGDAPFVGFVLCDLEEVTSGLSHYGYQALTGAWIIKRFDDTTGALRYAAGATNYPGAWSGRASLTFNLPCEA